MRSNSSILKRHQLTEIDTLAKEGDCLCYRKDLWVSIQGLVRSAPCTLIQYRKRGAYPFLFERNAGGDTKINIKVCPEESLYVSFTGRPGLQMGLSAQLLQFKCRAAWPNFLLIMKYIRFC